jgi:DNA repair protein RadC
MLGLVATAAELSMPPIKRAARAAARAKALRFIRRILGRWLPLLTRQTKPKRVERLFGLRTFVVLLALLVIQSLPMTGMRLKDQPASERPRERLASRGADALSPAELVAILLRTGLRGANVLEISKQLVQKYGSLGALAQASLDDLQTVKGIGRDKAVTLAAAFALARRMAAELRQEAPVLDTPEAVASLMREDTRLRNVETFQILLLNTRRRLIDVAKVADGTLDTILVHPREVFKPAIAANAAAIILLHNHPSGEATPSEADIKVTRDLIRAGQLLKIEVLDHVILGRATQERPKDYVSLRELGYFAGS